MGSDLRPGVVGDFVSLQRGTTYKGLLVGQPGPALLGLGSIEPGGGFRAGDYKTYGGECPANLMLFPGDLYVALKGATKDGKMIGSVARVPPSVPSGRLTQDTVKLIFRSQDPVEKSYLYWVLRTPQYRSYCAGHATGSAVVALSRDDFLSYPVPPFTQARQGLTALFESIEQKIELNRRMSATLEAIARAIFKSWFVDFDPVRAKAEGRDPPGMDAQTAALFPKDFEDSPLAKIPKGWRVQRLGDVVGINESSIARSYPHETIEYVDISSVSSGRLDTTVQHDLSSAPSRARRLVSHGDTIWSCVRPNRKSYLFIHQPVPNLVVSTGFAVLTAKEIPPSYLYAWVTADAFVDYLSYSADGSAYPAVRPERFAEALILIPPRPVLDRFEEIAGPIRDAVASNEEESRTLAGLRDTLLPELISGQIRVKDVEKLVETTE